MSPTFDREWADRLLAELGPRYRLGAPGGAAVELQHRSGKAEFRPSRVLLGGGETGRELTLIVDVRVPKGSAPEAADPLVSALERQALAPRGYARASDETMTQRSQTGNESGWVRTLGYRHRPADPTEAARAIRAIVESIDIPIVVGIHDAADLIARDPPPPAPKPALGPGAPLDRLYFDLEGGLLHALTVVVDPNDRTLRVRERRLLGTRPIGDVVKLAHVAKLGVRVEGGRAHLVAIPREGGEVVLATAAATPAFVATASRLAKAVMIPIEDL